jgi:hypothetical protein
MQIKKITSSDFKKKLKFIFLKSNRIYKYKDELKKLYTEKIDKDNKQQMKMLYDIWSHHFPNDKNIQDIDKKWRKNY